MSGRATGAGAQPVDGVFRALSDPTRRRVLERLSASPASVSELAAPFTMALPSFVQHLRILEECGLVRSQKRGRVRTYRLAPERLRLAEDWLVRQRAFWERRLDQFDEYVIGLKEEQAHDTRGDGETRSQARPRARSGDRRAAGSGLGSLDDA